MYSSVETWFHNLNLVSTQSSRAYCSGNIPLSEVSNSLKYFHLASSGLTTWVAYLLNPAGDIFEIIRVIKAFSSGTITRINLELNRILETHWCKCEILCKDLKQILYMIGNNCIAIFQTNILRCKTKTVNNLQILLIESSRWLGVQDLSNTSHLTLNEIFIFCIYLTWTFVTSP